MDQEQPEHKNRLYWFFHNLRVKLINGIKAGFKKRPLLYSVILILVLYTLYVSRASIQPSVLIIRKYFLLVLIVIGVLWYFIRTIRHRNFKQSLLPFILMITFSVAAWFFGPPIHKYVSLYFHYSNVNKVLIHELPQTDNERIQPINSIKTLINQEALSETQDATFPRFARGIDGNYYFNTAIGPAREYKVQQFTKNMYELIHIPALLPSPVFSKKNRTEVNFEVGEFLLFSKNTAIAATKSFGIFKYLNYETAEPIYLEKEKGHFVQVVPLIYWKGIIFPRPIFGGVIEIEEETENDSYVKRVLLGKGKYISPEEIKLYPYLKGQNLIPKEVADFIAESFRFVNGFLAPFPGYHEGDVRIPSFSSDQSPQPFITYFKLDENEKLYNYYGLEPFQKNKKGLSISLFIPGDNDEQVYFIDHRNSDLSYIGSSAIGAKIIESKKNYDWSKNYPAESRPYIKVVDGKTRFFWLSTIVTKAGTEQSDYISGSIPEICLTDAVYGKVVWIQQDSLIKSNSWINTASKELADYWQSE